MAATKNRPTALAAEKQLIHRKLPKYNDEYNRKNPTRVDWRRQERQKVELRIVEPEAPEVLELPAAPTQTRRRRPTQKRIDPRVPAANGHAPEHWGGE